MFGRAPPSSKTSRFALLGPFSYLLTFSGFDLNNSLCGSRVSEFSNCRDSTFSFKRPRGRALFSTLVYSLAVILFTARTILVGSRDAPVGLIFEMYPLY